MRHKRDNVVTRHVVKGVTLIANRLRACVRDGVCLGLEVRNAGPMEPGAGACGG